MYAGPTHYALDTDDTLVVKTPSDKGPCRKLVFDDGNDRQVDYLCPTSPKNKLTGMIPISPDSDELLNLSPTPPSTPKHDQAAGLIAFIRSFVYSHLTWGFDRDRWNGMEPIY